MPPLARVVGGASKREPAASGELKAGLLRVLLVIASPKDLGRWGLPEITEGDRAEYHALFADLPELSVTTLESGTARAPTLNNLLDELRKGYDIVHLVCHGVLSYAQGSLDRNDYRLLLENEAGAVALVDSADLKRSLTALAKRP